MPQENVLCSSNIRIVNAMFVVAFLVNIVWISSSLLAVKIFESNIGIFIYWPYYLGFTNIIIIIAGLKKRFFPDKDTCLHYSSEKVSLVENNKAIIEFSNIDYALKNVPFCELMVCTSNFFNIKMYFPKVMFKRDDYRQFQEITKRREDSGKSEFKTAESNPIAKIINTIKDNLKKGDLKTWFLAIILFISMIISAGMRAGVL